MSAGEPEKVKFRPYARLLTMLGEQLIKNERIALVELIKNSYDADADHAFIFLEQFDDDLQSNPESKVIIEDDGEGMTLSVIKNSWMNPATSCKYVEEGNEPKRTKKHDRIVQGEKGIGRFATLKLGKKVRIITRPKDESMEYVIDFDFTDYDEEFLKKNGEEQTIFLDEIEISVFTRFPQIFIEDNNIKGKGWSLTRKNQGTRIEISNLKGKWTRNKLDDILTDISKLNPIFSEHIEFPVHVILNNRKESSSIEKQEELLKVLENCSVLKITNGKYDNEEHRYHFSINGENQTIDFDSVELKEKKDFRDRFHLNKEIIRYPKCGPFSFSFYIFDLQAKDGSKYYLSPSEKKQVKNHRIYLYRDDIRVYPYGDPVDDWLQIDVLRGTQKAGLYLSNDQIVGCIEISKGKNPDLKDKTNREGLIEKDESTDDFIGAIRIFLEYIKHKYYDAYKLSLENKKAQDIYRTEQINSNFSEIKSLLKNSGDTKTLALVTQAEKFYKTERDYLVQRAEKTEELAGVGLSVEVASHDITLMMGKIMKTLDDLIISVLHKDISSDILSDELNKLKGMASFISTQLKDIQLLFRSSKKRRKNIKVKLILEKVIKIYNRTLKSQGINCTVEEIGSSPLIAKTTDAVLLQLFLNLLDNAVFWLSICEKDNKNIRIVLDGTNGKLIFSDNGPGISEDDRPYIFEAYYSGKGEEGRGLGLYIARQLLERHDYSIDLADIKSDKILEGANFVVNFVSEGER